MERKKPQTKLFKTMDATKRVILRIALLLALVLTNEIASATNTNTNTNAASGNILKGNVIDAETGEPLIGATVVDQTTKQGTVTDINGDFAVTVPSGVRTLVISYLGYETQEFIYALRGENDRNVEIQLHPIAENLHEVLVSTTRKGANLMSNEMGMQKLESKTIKAIPVLMGETDVIKVIQLMPGVQPASEGSTGYSVRGGNPDQNLVLLDGATIYNAGHILGFFSVFNNDAVNDVKLYKGDMPASMGGRLASVLDVEMRCGDNRKFHGEGGIGLISSRLTLEGPIHKGTTSFLVSGRRTYFDLFLPLSGQESVRKSDLHFYDLNGKITHVFNQRNRLFFSSYMGKDVMAMTSASMEFSNKALSLRYSHLFNDVSYVNITALAVKNGYLLETSQDEATTAFWESNINDYGLKIDMTHAYETCKLDYGISSTYHKFEPGTAEGKGEHALIGKFEMPKNYALENAAYINCSNEISERLKIRYGVRFSSSHNMGRTTVFSYDENYKVCDSTEYGKNKVYKSYFGVEPRFSAALKVTEATSVKASYSRAYQYMQQASCSTSGSPMDIWFMSSPNVKPQRVDQFSLGWFHNFHNDDIELSVEGFYKEMRNTIDFKDHPQIQLNKFLEGELRFGSSRAYGIETMAKFNFGNLNGWVNYTLSRADRRIIGVNNDKRYLSPYNHSHDCNVVANYSLGRRCSFSANWVFTSGAPTTYPVARYEVGNTVLPFYSDRNKDQFPHYHRLDLSFTLANKKNPTRKWNGEWVFSIYNVYSHHNTWAVQFARQEDDNHVATQEVKAEKVYLFPIIPSVSYNFKF